MILNRSAEQGIVARAGISLRTRTRGSSGIGLAESTASLSLLLPVIITLVFVILEISMSFFIQSTLSEAARQAARDLAIAYGVAPSVTSSRTMQNTMVFDNIRIANVVNSSEQFDDPVFSTATDPATVTVNIRYASNQYGLPAFPSTDPLHLGSDYLISASCTYRLE